MFASQHFLPRSGMYRFNLHIGTTYAGIARLTGDEDAERLACWVTRGKHPCGQGFFPTVFNTRIASDATIGTPPMGWEKVARCRSARRTERVERLEAVVGRHAPARCEV